jgi:hypothetical protein
VVVVMAAAKRVRRVEVEEAARQPRRRPTGRVAVERAPVSTNQRAVAVAPHPLDHRQAQARPFIDARTEVQKQQPNEDSLPFDLGKYSSDAHSKQQQP